MSSLLVGDIIQPDFVLQLSLFQPLLCLCACCVCRRWAAIGSWPAVPGRITAASAVATAPRAAWCEDRPYPT